MLQPIFTNSLKLVSLPVDRLIDVPLYCYDFIGLCSSSLCLEYISKINIKNGYIFIIPDKEKCASL